MHMTAATDSDSVLAALEPQAAQGITTSAAATARAAATRAWLEANHLLEHHAECRVGIVTDEALLLHSGPSGHPERPARLQEILKQLDLSCLLSSCHRIPSREASNEELLRVHTERHLEKVHKFDASVKKKGKAYALPFGPDTFVNEHTAHCAALSTGCLLALVDACMEESCPVQCGMAVIRPPGHHAMREKASGFCLFNNVAVAARHMQQQYGVKRVAIIDWDVHHGNGTNEFFAEDNTVLFFSMHRFDRNGFFPGTGVFEDTGKSEGKGFSVNVPLDKGYGDLDVCHIMRYIVCPLMERFQPEVIFVSAGFDAVKGDPLGECRISPEGFAWMTRCLYRLAGHYCQGRLILALEGGYNPDMIAQCTVECLRSLLSETSGTTLHGNSLAVDDFCPPDLSPPPSLPSTPASMSPAASPFQVVTPTSTPRITASVPPGSPTPPASPTGGTLSEVGSTSRQKVRGPAPKTLSTVRRLTELHNLLALQLPIAPKQFEGPGHVSKSAKRERRRKQRSGSQGGEEDDASSDSSGWAIACGSSDADFFYSPAIRPLSRQRSMSGLPDLELPPLASAEVEDSSVGVKPNPDVAPEPDIAELTPSCSATEDEQQSGCEADGDDVPGLAPGHPKKKRGRQKAKQR